MADINVRETRNICKASASVGVATGSPLSGTTSDFAFKDEGNNAVAPRSYSITVTGSTSYSVYATADPDVFTTSEWVEIENSPFTAAAIAGDNAAIYGLRVTNNDGSNAAVVRIVGRL